MKNIATPTETSVHRDALCFLVKTWARHKTTEALLNNDWRLAAVGGWRLAVGGWRLAVGGWRVVGRFEEFLHHTPERPSDE